jgi:hypothetical protein
MRSPIAKAVRVSFSRRMQEELPQFTRTSSKLPGDLLYVQKFAKNLNFYINLLISHKSYQDSFTIELARSIDDYPFSRLALDPAPLNDDGTIRFRLPQLYREEWRPRTGWEPWWWIGPPMIPRNVTSKALERALTGKRPLIDEIPIEEALPLVETQVQDAFERLKRFGISYFKQFSHQ